MGVVGRPGERVMSPLSGADAPSRPRWASANFRPAPVGLRRTGDRHSIDSSPEMRLLLISPVGRGILAAILLFSAIAWMSWIRAHPSTVVEHTTGEVLDVSTAGLGTDSTPVVRVRLADGREVRVMVGMLIPTPGQVLPFVVESRGEGTDAYVAFDSEAWLDGGFGG